MAHFDRSVQAPSSRIADITARILDAESGSAFKQAVSIKPKPPSQFATRGNRVPPPPIANKASVSQPAPDACRLTFEVDVVSLGTFEFDGVGATPVAAKSNAIQNALRLFKGERVRGAIEMTTSSTISPGSSHASLTESE